MERDKFLTEAMGECWHGWSGSPDYCECGAPDYVLCPDNTDFSTWQGFGKLWEWAQEQEWFQNLMESMWDDCVYGGYGSVELMVGAAVHQINVNPDRFANAIYEFLKERNHDM